MTSSKLIRIAAVCVPALVAFGGCGDDGPPGETYFDRNIQPILTTSCAGNVAGCHATNPDDPFAFAAGNFDVTSFENVQKRPDVLRTFGPYPVPLLLVKAVGNSGELGFNYDGRFVPLEVEHVGGTNLKVGSEAYLTLLSWLENGATENGLPPPAPPTEGDGPCSPVVPGEFDDGAITSNENFDTFKNDVQPIMEACNSGNCHGTPAGDFYLTCGDDDRQVAWNFKQVQAFVDDPVDNSQVLNVPLAVSEGGLFHSGGEHFGSRSDADYETIRDWAAAVGRVEFGEGDAGQTFFRQHVQPKLIQRGCHFEACHSPAATNDLKLRAGSQGFFSAVALERNYEVVKNEFMALEVPDARRGRAVAKGILPRFGGIAHRGGPVLETAGSGGAIPANCPQPFDGDTATGFCVLQEWMNVERAPLISAGEVAALGSGATVPLVYVDRAESHVAGPLQFDTYQPDSDLFVVSADIGVDGAISVTDPVGTRQSLLDNCPGAANRTQVDVSAPDINPDGNMVVFSMRTAAASPRQVFMVDLAGTTCTQVTASEADVGGIKIHNFDPAWSRDGQWIVFASTRGTASGAPTPTLSRQLFLPQSDIFRIRPNGTDLERMTVLTNSEIGPQMMREGRVIMTTEKVAKGFYQLAGRRLNWDLTDYHPLLAQRSDSAFALPGDPEDRLPSVGYSQATEVREGFNGNFLLVFSDAGARAGAGTLATFNRSIGPVEAGRGDEGSSNYTAGYLASVRVLDPNATGRVGTATSGAYKSPFPLLDGRVMAAYTPYAGDLAAATSLDFDLVAVDRDGRRTTIIGGARQQVEAVLAIPYPDGKLYRNFRQLVFGGGSDTSATGGSEWAVVHFPDLPLLFTLLTANLRRGRPVEVFAEASKIAVYQERSPTSAAGNTPEGIFEDRVLLGAADLASDGSAKLRAPAGVPLILQLQDDRGNPVVTMEEEHQFGPGEAISMGVVAPLFDQICGGCHGSISGRETDIFVTPDVLTGASKSMSQNVDPATF